jgi:hypothetical protein
VFAAPGEWRVLSAPEAAAPDKFVTVLVARKIKTAD